MPDFEAKTVYKNPPPRGQCLFSPKHSDYKKPKNILTPPGWPYPNDPNKATTKCKHQNPHAKTNSHEPRREVKEPARPHSSEETKTQDEEDKQNKKTEPNKTREKQKHPPPSKKNTNTEQNESKKCRHKRQIGPKKALHQTPKQRNNNK